MKLRFHIIIILMAISLFGIIVVQVLWIRHAIEAEEAQFDKSVYNALSTGISQLEKEDMFYFMDTKMRLPAPTTIVMDSLMNIYVPSPENVDVDVFDIDSGQVFTGSNSQIIQSDKIGNRSIVTVIKNGNQSVVWNSDNDYQVSVEYDPAKREFEMVEILHEHELDALKELDDIQKNQQYIIFQKELDSMKDVLIENQKEREVRELVVRQKMKQFNKSVQQWAFEYSFEEDQLREHGILTNIEEVVERALINNGIVLSFNSQVIKEKEDTILIMQSSMEDDEILSGEYQTELFPNDFFRKDLYLLVDFPTKSSHIYRSVSMLALGSVSFTAIILLTFGLTLYYINKQKKISEVKSDFINNMTHEFKTPIATINLASDTLGSPKIIGNHEKTRYYLDIIKQENKRMNNQVEKVLQMALIENQDLQLDFQKTDLHPIIENTVHVAELTAKEKKGKIITVLRANCSEVPVDEIHFANILNNLLDNAMKYTEKPPEILVETFSKENKVYIRISDNGIGMSKEVQKHIFDKFYRKPSGNIHNIKGFGLGLSYVKAIVDAHGGDILVSSEPGNGSIFTLSFDC